MTSSATESVSMPEAHDRITEAYFGKFGGAFSRDTRERIHWICSQVSGNLVLDVGCSQGIVAILLAREGKKVVALDTDSKVIEEAKSFLSKEQEGVRARVDLLHEDFLQTNFGQTRFDSIVMTEVLEHLIDPKAFVAAAAHRLSVGGRFIVTVPFGINDWFDHKQTFYVLGPWLLLTESFVVEDIALFGKWIGFVARKATEGEVLKCRNLPFEAIAKVERNFQSIERHLVDQTTSLTSEVARMKKRLQTVIDENKIHREAVAESDNARAIAEAALSELRKRYEEARTLLDRLQQQVVEQERNSSVVEMELVRRVAGMGARLERVASIEDTLRSLEANLARIREELSSHTEMTSSLSAEVVTQERHRLQSALADRELKLVALEQELLQAKVQSGGVRAAAEQRLEASERERSALDLRLAALEGALRQTRKETLNLREQLAESRSSAAAAEEGRSAAFARAAKAEQDLSDCQQKLSQALAAEAALMQAKAENNQAYEKLKKAERETSALKKRVEKLQAQKVSADLAAERVRSTISFRLGHALIFGLKSWQNFRQLPAELASIRAEAKRRRSEKKAGSAVSAATATPTATERSAASDASIPVLAEGRIGDMPDSTSAQSEALLDEVYKWKRRAIGWEKKAKEASIGGLAFETLLELAKGLPVSNGSRIHKRFPLKVGIITDVYMYNFYKDVFLEVHYLSPDNFRQLFEVVPFDVIMYVTCWKGLENEEWRGIKYREKPASALSAIISMARDRGCKLIFQSIEDPSNFDYFIPVAERFDYVFTTDEDCVDRYKEILGHERVYYGEYGANPLLNNPIGCRRHSINAAFFAGSWAARYKERCEDMETVLDSVIQSGARVIIADRNYGTESADLQYPERFRDRVVPPIEHGLLQSVHKLFRYSLNFNSIKDSPTMCAMRVYELQAMGVGVLSNYARSVFNRFPEMRIVPWPQDLRGTFERSADFDEYKRNMTLVRNVMTDKTSYDIVARMLSNVGYQDCDVEPPVVCVICDEEGLAAHVSFQRQRYAKKILVRKSDVDSEEKWRDVCQRDNVSYFTWFTESDEYEENYLVDLVNGFKYTAARYVGKAAWFKDGSFMDAVQHDYIDTIPGRARTLFSAAEFIPCTMQDLAPHEPVHSVAGGYAIDPFELNCNSYIRSDNPARPSDKTVLSVIVPVYNNGRFLRAKCIESLKRNKTWPSIEVILVDDGSSDEETLLVIRQLSTELRNVRVFTFEDGGSGSASRPRNKGLELASAPLISFLDPDNEISPGGYDVLLQLHEEASLLREGGVDFVSGYHVKVEERAKAIGKHSAQRLLIIDDLRAQFFARGRFPVIPTQPAVIDKRLFEGGSLRFVEGSAGQDTLFGWDLLCHAQNGAFTDAAYLIYYAQREGSVTNDVDRRYFEKKLILEKSQSSMLRANGLMELYLQNHYDRFMRDWYLPKLALVREAEEKKRCFDIVQEIAQLYGRSIVPYDAHEATNVVK